MAKELSITFGKAASDYGLIAVGVFDIAVMAATAATLAATAPIAIPLLIAGGAISIAAGGYGLGKNSP